MLGLPAAEDQRLARLRPADVGSRVSVFIDVGQYYGTNPGLGSYFQISWTTVSKSRPSIPSNSGLEMAVGS